MAGTGIPPQYHPHHQQWQQPPPHPHLHPHPHPSMPMPPPPPLQILPVENPNRTTLDELRTIFISGLPADVKERELQNLLRWLPGYEASQLNLKTEPPMGFALFTSSHYAISAKDTLQGMLFDPESKSVLHTEMAKKNLFMKRGVVADPYPVDQSKRLRTGGDYTHTGYPSQAGFHPPPPTMPPPNVWGHQGYMPPPPPQYDPYVAYQGPYPVPPPVQMPMTMPAPLPAPTGYALVQNSKDNPPCNTLFIGNLGENVIEEELRNLFSGQPGFKQMKLLRQERNTVCFIEFEDVGSATNVHQNLQGAVVPSSGRGGMRIQFSKNPFGRRKDGFNLGGSLPAEANGAIPAPQPQMTF